MRSASSTGARGLAILAALLGLIASTAYGAPMDLSNGVPVKGLAGAAGSEKFYLIEVPPGQDQLEISTSLGTGDVDLYVRRDSEPTTTSYDYRPYKIGNEETVTVGKPAAGTWYVMLKGYAAYSDVTLKADYSGEVSNRALVNGVPVEDLTGATGSEQFFSIEVPADQSELEIKISGGTGDADLYVGKDNVPTTSKYEYRPYVSGNNETVTVKNPAAGTWHIMIEAKKAFAGVTLLAEFRGGVPVLANNVPVTDLAGQPGSETIYRIEVPAGQTSLEIRMSGGTGDADLYVKLGSRPTTTDYDYRPFVIGNNEAVTVDNPAAGTWFVMVRGYSDFTGITLKAAFGEILTLKDGVPVPKLSGASGSESFFKIEVPAGQAHLLFQMSGGSGNADLYIRRNSKPTTSTWDYRPIQSDNDESISIGNPGAGTWYVMLKGAAAYSGLTLEADYRAAGTPTVLKNNVPVTGISGAAKDERFFKIEVPAGQETLEIRMSGGTGDADLYVKRGVAPKTTDYDYRPYLIGNDEAVDVRSPEAGTWYVMIRGYQAFAGITLVAKYGAGTVPDDTTALESGVAVTGIEGAANSEKFYKIEVPAGQARLEIFTSGGTGDMDLYVRKGARPSTKEWDYRPYVIGNNEKVTVDNPQAGTWYVLIRGYSFYGAVTLKATYFPVAEQVTELRNGTPVDDLSGAASSEKFYQIEVPAGQASLAIAIAGGTGDVDLYVRKGSKPTMSSYDYRPYLIGNDEKVEVATPAAGTWYVMLLGYQAYTGVTLKAEHQPVEEKVVELEKGVPARGLAGAASEEKFFSIEVPAGQDFLNIELAGGVGNADLYVRKGSKPTTSTWDHRSDRSGNDEKVEIAEPDAATWFILVRGEKAWSGAALTAAFGARPGGNDFASDPNCVALWQFEDKAFAKDTVGSNELENHGAALVTAGAPEGDGCADFRASQDDWMGIDDDHLSADFPARYGSKSVNMSLSFWMKPRSFPFRGTVLSKYLISTDDRSWRLFLSGSGSVKGYLQIALGIGSGNNYKQYDLDDSSQQFAKDQWYHVAFTYQDRNREFHVRIWDEAAGKLVYDYAGKATSAMAVTRAPVVLGGLPMMSEHYDGLLDEVAVFNDVLTSDEIDLIRQGRYNNSK